MKRRSTSHGFGRQWRPKHLGAVPPAVSQIPLLSLQPFRAHRPERLARLPQHGQRILRRANQPGLERTDEREVEQPLRLGADGLGIGGRRLELGDRGAAVVQEREEALEGAREPARPARRWR